MITLMQGDCIEAMRTMPDASVDAVVTDPPYGLGFMGAAWDALPPGEEWARECLRLLKPGGHLLAFGGTRTWHRLAVAVEDAGFELRDSIAWLYGSGFPKSLDVSKAIDKAAGAEREVIGLRSYGEGQTFTGSAAGGRSGGGIMGEAVARGPSLETAPATDAAREWQGWGTALKPAFEPIAVGRKPLIGTVAANVLAHGTGALNIDGCRIGTTDNLNGGAYSGGRREAEGATSYAIDRGGLGEFVQPAGRWPANVVLDPAAAAELDAQSGVSKSTKGKPRGAASGNGWGMTATGSEYDDTGGASRFFYVAKAPARERPQVDGKGHPTVKPLTLMRWLVRLVTPPGGVVLEPFLGSGTTAQACELEGFDCIGIERDPDYLRLTLARLTNGART